MKIKVKYGKMGEWFEIKEGNFSKECKELKDFIL